MTTCIPIYVTTIIIYINYRSWLTPPDRDWETSIPDISALGIVVYPNPTKNTLTIETRLDIQIEVHDLMGKLLIKTKNVNRLDLSDLSNGLYNLSIIHKDKRYNKQIIKQ